VLSGAPENTLPESESTVFSFMWAWEHQEVLKSTGEINWGVGEVCMGLLD